MMCQCNRAEIYCGEQCNECTLEADIIEITDGDPDRYSALALLLRKAWVKGFQYGGVIARETIAMLKIEKSKEHHDRIAEDAVNLATSYIDGLNRPIKPMELEDAAKRILKELKSWASEITNE